MTELLFLSRFKKAKGRTPFIYGWKDIRQAPYTGTCNDFALSVALDLAGSWLRLAWWTLTLKVTFWWSYSEYSGLLPTHNTLYVRGKGWIDSNYPYWRKTPIHHTPVFPLLPPWPWFRAVWGKLL